LSKRRTKWLLLGVGRRHFVWILIDVEAGLLATLASHD
jgi:hypothetical protein